MPSLLTTCNCVLSVRDAAGNPYGAIGGTKSGSFAELSFYTRKSQINSGDSLYLSKPERSKAMPGVVIQDLTYIAKDSPTSVPSITYTGGGTAGSEVVTVSGNDISVQIQSGVSTADQVKNAVNASVAASAIVYCIVSDQDARAQVTASKTTFDSEICYIPLTSTNTTNLQGIFQLVWNDGSNYDTIIFDPVEIPNEDYLDLTTVLTVSRG